MLTPEGPRYDYGVPKYVPMPAPGMPSYGAVPAPSQETTADLVREATARARAQQRATCLEVVRLREFLRRLGVEPTTGKGCAGQFNNQ